LQREALWLESVSTSISISSPSCSKYFTTWWHWAKLDGSFYLIALRPAKNYRLSITWEACILCKSQNRYRILVNPELHENILQNPTRGHLWIRWDWSPISWWWSWTCHCCSHQGRLAALGTKWDPQKHYCYFHHLCP